VVEDLLEWNGWLARMAVGRVTRVGVRAREQPAQVAPAPSVANEQRDVPVGLAVRAGRRLDGDLGAEDRTHR
jgi:hypothetical protein